MVKLKSQQLIRKAIVNDFRSLLIKFVVSTMMVNSRSYPNNLPITNNRNNQKHLLRNIFSNTVSSIKIPNQIPTINPQKDNPNEILINTPMYILMLLKDAKNR